MSKRTLRLTRLAIIIVSTLPIFSTCVLADGQKK